MCWRAGNLTSQSVQIAYHRGPAAPQQGACSESRQRDQRVATENAAQAQRFSALRFLLPLALCRWHGLCTDCSGLGASLREAGSGGPPPWCSWTVQNLKGPLEALRNEREVPQARKLQGTSRHCSAGWWAKVRTTV